jgi:membrane protease YdiL (CAAX protease family)
MLMLMLVAGLVGLVILIVLFSIRKLKPRLESRRGGSHVFGETFAIWLILFNAIQISVELFVDGKYRLMAVGAGFFASLCALSWPIARGLTWTETREMIGWRLRSSMFLEAFWGVVSYVSFTPVLLIAVLMTSLLAQIGAGLGWTLFAQLDGKNAPSHPIVFELAKGDPLVLATVIFLACVAAPIIEETMFRGVLYRHLRGATASTRRWISVAFSAALNSFVFAAIHPQGVVAIPVLGTLAVAFSLVREWRESLIAPMVMHAMNNTIMVVMFLLVINSL